MLSECGALLAALRAHPHGRIFEMESAADREAMIRAMGVPPNSVRICVGKATITCSVQITVVMHLRFAASTIDYASNISRGRITCIRSLACCPCSLVQPFDLAFLSNKLASYESAAAFAADVRALISTRESVLPMCPSTAPALNTVASELNAMLRKLGVPPKGQAAPAIEAPVAAPRQQLPSVPQQPAQRYEHDPQQQPLHTWGMPLPAPPLKQQPNPAYGYYTTPQASMMGPHYGPPVAFPQMFPPPQLAQAAVMPADRAIDKRVQLQQAQQQAHMRVFAAQHAWSMHQQQAMQAQRPSQFSIGGIGANSGVGVPPWMVAGAAPSGMPNAAPTTSSAAVTVSAAVGGIAAARPRFNDGGSDGRAPQQPNMRFPAARGPATSASPSPAAAGAKRPRSGPRLQPNETSGVDSAAPPTTGTEPFLAATMQTASGLQQHAPRASVPVSSDWHLPATHAPSNVEAVGPSRPAGDSADDRGSTSAAVALPIAVPAAVPGGRTQERRAVHRPKPISIQTLAVLKSGSPEHRFIFSAIQAWDDMGLPTASRRTPVVGGVPVDLFALFEAVREVRTCAGKRGMPPVMSP